MGFCDFILDSNEDILALIFLLISAFCGFFASLMFGFTLERFGVSNDILRALMPMVFLVFLFIFYISVILMAVGYIELKELNDFNK